MKRGRENIHQQKLRSSVWQEREKKKRKQIFPLNLKLEKETLLIGFFFFIKEIPIA